MAYELAKKLKDAGFPQHDRTGEWYNVCYFQGCEKDACFPTLSELIETCGDDFLSLEKYDGGKWEAMRRTWCCDEHGESCEFGYGSTPEEAVANLWLALHEKV